MSFTRIFILSLALVLTSSLAGQKPTKKATTPSTTQLKPTIDTFGMAERMKAFQIFSNKVNALAKEEKKSDKTVERFVAMTNELAANYPCGRFPSTLLNSQGKPLSLKEQDNVYSNLFQSVREARPATPENGSPESGIGLTHVELCLLEYYQYTHHLTRLGQALPHIVIITNVALHQANMMSITGSAGSCYGYHLYEALPVNSLPASPFE